MNAVPENFEVLQCVFGFLDARDLARVSAVCKLWNAVANTELLWRSQCEHTFRLQRLVGVPSLVADGDFRDRNRPTHSETQSDSYRSMFVAWHSRLPRPLGSSSVDSVLQARVQCAWAAVLPTYAVEELVSAEELQEFLLALCDISTVAPAVYAFYLNTPHKADIGEYQFYNHSVRLRLCNLSKSLSVRFAALCIDACLFSCM